MDAIERKPTPREPEQPEVAPQVPPASEAMPDLPLPAARVPVELLELIAIFDARLSALEAPQPYIRPKPGEDGKDGTNANCEDVTAKLNLLMGRVEALETMLRPDASGRMTGLLPFGVTYHNELTGEELKVRVYLGEGFLIAPPRQFTPSLSGGGQ